MDAKEAAETLSKCHGEFVPTKEFQQKLFDAGIVVVVPPFDDEWWGDEVCFHGRFNGHVYIGDEDPIECAVHKSIGLIDNCFHDHCDPEFCDIKRHIDSGPGVVLMHVEGKDDPTLRLSASFPHESFRVKGSRNTGIAFSIEDATSKEPA